MVHPQLTSLNNSTHTRYNFQFLFFLAHTRNSLSRSQTRAISKHRELIFRKQEPKLLPHQKEDFRVEFMKRWTGWFAGAVFLHPSSAPRRSDRESCRCCCCFCSPLINPTLLSLYFASVFVPG